MRTFATLLNHTHTPTHPQRRTRGAASGVKHAETRIRTFRQTRGVTRLTVDVHKHEVDDFCQKLTKEAEDLVSKFFPLKIEELQVLLKTSFSCDNLASLKAPLDIPIPDPAKEEAKRKKKEEKEAKEGKKDKDEDKEDEDSGPPCGPICTNQRVEHLLQLVKPQIQTLKEKLNVVSMWVQLQIPKIEDGNNFGVAVQEKVFELLTNTRTRIEGFQTQISKYYNERGDAVAKASKQSHVGDYRQLVHELDQYQYCELRLVILEICSTYAVLFDIINKNYDKIKKPKGDGKALIY
uniref:Proteasome activator complex subunit 1 n=2 Tax=Gasterosteus aculeatus aculeatus TaxID=481459 RepID=A0AAQ4RMT9_GASAC